MKANPADYELARPGSLPAVLALMAAGGYTPLAGGTELMVQFNAGRLRPRRLVDIFGLPELAAITITEGEITIGAGVTYTTLRRHPALAAALPLLAQAASWTGAIANQNRGTLGGNIANGSPAADTPPALLAYAAELSLISARGTRRIPYDSFHTGYKQSVLAPDELILALHIPCATYTNSYIRKVGARAAQAISKVALAAVATVSAANHSDGRITLVRIGLASVASGPYRCRATEAALTGAPLNAATIATARAALVAEISPLDDIRSTADYRAHVAANLLEEFLQQLSPNTNLTHFNQRPAKQAIATLLPFCASNAWAEAVATARPYASADALFAAADQAWFALPEPAHLQAFAAHPRIGEQRAEASSDFLAHSTAEQRATQQTLAQVAEQLKTLNRQYERQFGFLYIVFASERTAPELLKILERRLGNTREQELAEAALQQARITRLRIERWLQQVTQE